MDNLRIYANLADGSALEVEAESGRELIEALLGDDVRPPPSVLVIEATAPDGRTISIRVPYDERRRAGISDDRT